MKLLIAIVLLFMLNETINAEGQCTKFLTLYYNCINGTYTTNPNKQLQDSFYNSALSGINNFTQSMDYFRSLFKSLRSCNYGKDKCDCIKKDKVYINSFERFFTSDYLYPQMVTIKSAVKTKYNILPINSITNTNPFITPILSYKNLNGFCLKYEYDSAINYFYKETLACYNNLIVSNPRYQIDCYSTYISMDFYTSSRSSKDQFEKYFACIGNLFRTCEARIRRSILFDFFSSVPTFIKNDKMTNLTTYIDYLYGLNYVPSLLRNATSLNEMALISLNKAPATCSYSKNNQPYTLLDSNSLKITRNSL